MWVLGNDVKGIDKSLSWHTTSFPSFSECDVLIVDTTTLNDPAIKSLTFDHAKNLFDEISKRLKTGFTIICIVSKTITGVTAKDHSIITNYFWSPFVFRFDEIPISKSIKPISEFPFENYLKKIKELKIALKLNPYLKDSCQSDYSIVRFVTDPVPFHSLIQNNSNDIFGGIYYHVHDQIPSGDMIMLPPLESSEKSIQAILEEIGVIDETPPPKWTDKIIVPGIDTINENIKQKIGKIRDIQNEITALVSQKNDLDGFKKLLYSGDKELEQIVKESLSFLGISDIREGRNPGLEDLIFNFKFEKIDICVIEVKSSTKLIKLDDLRQADNWAWDYRNKGKKVKTLVIANIFRLEDIGSSKKLRMDFRTFEEFYQKHEICIIPTLVLFELIKSKLDGKGINRKKFENVINNSNSVLTFEDFT